MRHLDNASYASPASPTLDQHQLVLAGREIRAFRLSGTTKSQNGQPAYIYLMVVQDNENKTT